MVHKFPNAVCDPLFSTGPHDRIGLRETLAAKETRRNAHVQQERRDLQTRRRDDASVPCWRHAQVPHHRSPHPRYSHQEADHAGRRGKSCWSFSKTEFLLDTANWNHSALNPSTWVNSHTAIISDPSRPLSRSSPVLLLLSSPCRGAHALKIESRTVGSRIDFTRARRHAPEKEIKER